MIRMLITLCVLCVCMHVCVCNVHARTCVCVHARARVCVYFLAVEHSELDRK